MYNSDIGKDFYIYITNGFKVCYNLNYMILQEGKVMIFVRFKRLLKVYVCDINRKSLVIKLFKKF